MLPDFEMIQHSFIGGHDIKIIPISDVHLGSPECMEQEFIKMIDAVAKEENTYLTLGGDLIDNGTKSSVTNSFKATMSPSQQKKEMVNILKPVKDKILCLVSGNHERRSGKDADDDPTYDIASVLGIENLYRENVAFLKIKLGRGNGRKDNYRDRPVYSIVVTHGAGGGIMTGSAVNRSERFGYVIDGMDILIVGHTHKPFTTQPGKLKIDLNNNKVTMKPFRVVCATSWLQYSGYPVQKMLLPASNCPQFITLSGLNKNIKVTM